MRQSAGNPDPNYPYAGRRHRRLRLDVAAQTLKPPTYTDLMGYCNNEWISDYTYTGCWTTAARTPTSRRAFAQAMQPCLLVWGRIVDGQPVLEPAFQVVTRPALPARTGPYTRRGRDAAGRLVGVPGELRARPGGR